MSGAKFKPFSKLLNLRNITIKVDLILTFFFKKNNIGFKLVDSKYNSSLLINKYSNKLSIALTFIHLPYCSLFPPLFLAPTFHDRILINFTIDNSNNVFRSFRHNVFRHPWNCNSYGVPQGDTSRNDAYSNPSSFASTARLLPRVFYALK